MAEQVKSLVRNRLLQHGYAPHVADGIMMNINDESSFNPTAVGDNGAAYGLFQHNGPRMRNLKSWASQNGLDPADPITQVDFAHYEMQNGERGTFDALQSTKTTGEAADVFLRKYERPAEINIKNRSAKYLGNSGTSYTNASDTTQVTTGNEPDIQYGGVTDDTYSTGMSFTPPPEEPPKPKTKLGQFYDKHLPWITDDRADMLLAIGAGLLSGDDWASGAAAASENMLGIRQKHSDRDINAKTAQTEQARWEFEAGAEQDRFDRTLQNNQTQADKQRSHEMSVEGLRVSAAERQARAEAEAKTAAEQAERDKLYSGTGYTPTPPQGSPSFYGATAYDQFGQPVFDLKNESDKKTFRQSQSMANNFRTNNDIYQQYGPEKMAQVGTIVAQNIEKSIMSDGSVSMAAARAGILKDVGNDPIARQIGDSQFNAVETKLNAMTGAAYSTDQKLGVMSRYVILPGDNDERIRQKLGNIGNDALDESASLPFGRDYIGAIVNGSFKPIRVDIPQYQGTETAQPTADTSNGSSRPALNINEEQIQQRTQEMQTETASSSKSYNIPDKVAAEGVTPEMWNKIRQHVNSGKLTMEEVMTRYGLSEFEFITGKNIPSK